MEEATLTKNNIDDIVLVGGSSRIPKIQEMIKNYFNGKELCKNINADEAIAYGAAYQAAVVNGNENPKEKDSDDNDGLEKLVLVDVTPLSLGIETQGGVMSVVIKKNNPIPAKKHKTYKTTCDDQEEAKVSVYQGERKMVADNFKIGDFTVKIKGRGKAGSIKFRIFFEFDVNSVLNVTAKEINENNEENLVVTAEKMQMSDEEIEQKIQEAKVSVYQGERKLVADNFKIGDFTVKIKGRGKAGSIKFRIKFEFDVNSVLNVTAKEINENNEENLVVTAEKMQMSDDEIEQKIQDAKKYDEEDKKLVEAIQARINLQNLCYEKKANCDQRQKKIIDEIFKWIKDNKDASKDEIEEQKKKLLDAFK
jgi:L1 cell adhesion molecule like protein